MVGLVNMNKYTVRNKSMLPGKSLKINKRAGMFIPHSRVSCILGWFKDQYENNLHELKLFIFALKLA